jgi:hypothetical protein
MSENPEVIPLTRRRRAIWEYGGDLLRVNWWLSVLLLICIAANLVQSLVLVSIYSRPPYILTEDEGYVMYRTTARFRLSEANVQNYTNVVTSTLLDQNPGAYDLSPLLTMVTPRILDKYRMDAQNSELSRKATGERVYWNLYGIKRIFEPKYPQFIILAVQGEIVHLTASTDAANPSAPSRPISNTVLLKIYLQTVRPTPDNPFGLFLEGISNIPPESAGLVWDSAKPLDETLAPDGQPYAKRGATTATNPSENR